MPEKQRIVIMTSRYDPYFSGPALQAKRVITVMENRYDCTFTIVTQRGILSKSSTKNLVLLPCFRFNRLYSSKIALLIWSFSSSIYLIKNRKDINIIHSLDLFFPSLIFAVVSKLINKPFLAKSSIDGVITKGGIGGTIKRLILRNTAYIVSISSNTYRELVDSRFKKRNILKIPNGVDTDTFKPLDCELTEISVGNLCIKLNKFTALFTGSITHRKGVLDLLKIWRCFLRNDCDSLLILAGSLADNTYVEEVRSYIKDNEMEDNVIIIEHVKEVWKLYQVSDVYLFSSFKEGLPNSVLEAMATGLPVIARDIPGCRDLIKDGVHGYLIKDDEKYYESFLSKLMLLKSDRSLLRDIKNNNMKFICDEYSLQRVAEQYKKAYDRLLK